MNKRRTWPCDFKDCREIAEWYRIFKGTPVKVCTHHMAELGRRRWGKPVEFTELSGDDLDYLEEKDRETEFKCDTCGFVTRMPVLEAIVTPNRPIKCKRCGKILVSI